MLLIAWLTVSLAIAVALGGGVLTFRSLTAESRLIERRLSRTAAPAAPSAGEAATARGET